MRPIRPVWRTVSGCVLYQEGPWRHCCSAAAESSFWNDASEMAPQRLQTAGGVRLQLRG